MSFSERWLQWRKEVDLEDYRKRWLHMADEGKAVHGEADFVDAYPRSNLLDAGCGMGRLAIELAARGWQVIGVDNDPDMLDYARSETEEITWLQADLATLQLAERFNVIAVAGNVLVFVEPSQRQQVVANLASHLTAGGLLITGATYGQPFSAGLELQDFDSWCSQAGLELSERYATWERDPYLGAEYAVSVHTMAA